MSTDVYCNDTFQIPRLKRSGFLQPIRSWPEMHNETRITGIEFDSFWYDCACEGVACFLKCNGEPRATVLVVLHGGEISHIECRGMGDMRLEATQYGLISLEVARIFGLIGLPSAYH